MLLQLRVNSAFPEDPDLLLIIHMEDHDCKCSFMDPMSSPGFLHVLQLHTCGQNTLTQRITQKSLQRKGQINKSKQTTIA